MILLLWCFKGYKLKGKVIRPAMVVVNKITENLEEEKIK